MTKIVTVRYVYDGDVCTECCAAVEAIAQDGARVGRRIAMSMDSAVGSCEYKCTPSQSHRFLSATEEIEASEIEACQTGRVNKYTYTIFDGDPSVSGPCSWPSHKSVEIRARQPKNAIQRAERVARSIGRSCGQYSRGDSLWITLWDQDDMIVEQSTVTL